MFLYNAGRLIIGSILEGIQLQHIGPFVLRRRHQADFLEKNPAAAS